MSARQLFSTNLARLREWRGMTQAEAAEAAGVALVTWIKWEHGDRHPLADQLDAVAAALRVSVAALYSKPRKPSGNLDAHEAVMG